MGGMRSMKCPQCGRDIEEGDRFCKYCGTALKDEEVSVIGYPKECRNCRAIIKSPEIEYCPKCGHRWNPYFWQTIIGYIFGFLGGLIGIAFGIYLWTRREPAARHHGMIIFILSVVMSVLWALI